jgi:hypothetical protein
MVRRIETLVFSSNSISLFTELPPAIFFAFYVLSPFFFVEMISTCDTSLISNFFSLIVDSVAKYLQDYLRRDLATEPDDPSRLHYLREICQTASRANQKMLNQSKWSFGPWNDQALLFPEVTLNGQEILVRELKPNSDCSAGCCRPGNRKLSKDHLTVELSRRKELKTPRAPPKSAIM